MRFHSFIQIFSYWPRTLNLLMLFAVIGVLFVIPARWVLGEASLARQTANAYAGWLATRRDNHKIIDDVQLRTFEEVVARILNNYVEEVKAEDLLSAAKQKTVESYKDPTVVSDWEIVETGIDGMLSKLDAFSSFLDADENRLFDESLRGEFGGLGIEIGKGKEKEEGKAEEGVEVRNVFEDSPAKKAGMQIGDRIMEASGKDLRKASLRDVVLVLRGEPGSYVDVRILRKNGDKNQTIDMRIQREIIKDHPVTGEWLNDNIVIKISDFHYNTAPEMKKVLAELEAKGEPKGVILDLRGNRGGSFIQSVQVSDYFLDYGTIVFTEDRNKKRYYANGQTPDMSGHLPMVVLINGDSASASEIVAGAMRDRDRAILIGSKSYGKGSVQNVYRLSRGMALKLTTQYYFTPLGSSVNEGIVPDVEVADDPDKKGDEQLSEAAGILERLASYQEEKKEG